MSEDNIAPEEQPNDTEITTGNTEETNNDDSEVTTEEGSDGGENTGEESSKDKVDQKKKNPIEPWAARRIAGLNQERDQARQQAQEALRQNEMLLTQLAALQKGEKIEVTVPKVDPVNLTQVQIQEAAAKLVAQQKYAETIDSVIKAGNKEFPDFDQATRTLSDALGDVFIQAASTLVEMPDAHKIIQYLGNDPEEGQRIFSLSPVKQILELGKLSEKIQEPKVRSMTKVPDPITPVTGRAKVAPSLSTAKTMDEFVAIRQKEIAASGKKHLL